MFKEEILEKYLNTPRKKLLFERYKTAIKCRREFAQYFYDDIFKSLNYGYIPNEKAESSGSIGNPVDRIKEINRSFDCYCFMATSTLDILAHIINLIFDIQRIDKDIYLRSLNNNEELNKKSSTIAKLIDDFLDEEMLLFIDFRNNSAHVDLACKKLEIELDKGITYIIEYNYLEDTVEKNVKKDLKSFIEKIHPSINKFYDEVLKRINDDINIKE